MGTVMTNKLYRKYYALMQAKRIQESKTHYAILYLAQQQCLRLTFIESIQGIYVIFLIFNVWHHRIYSQCIKNNEEKVAVVFRLEYFEIVYFIRI